MLIDGGLIFILAAIVGLMALGCIATAPHSKPNRLGR
jgi:hypothetical protein